MTFSVQDSEQVSEEYKENVPRTVSFTESVPYQEKYTEKVPYVEEYTVQVPFQVAYTIQIPYKKNARGIAGAWKKVTRYRQETRYRAEMRNENRTRMKERTDTKYRTAYKNVNRSKTEYYTENRVRTVSKNVTRFCIDHASVAEIVRSNVSVSAQGIDSIVDKMNLSVVAEATKAEVTKNSLEMRVALEASAVERLETLIQTGSQLEHA
eukprot:TRINITY_DN609_c0_g1_i1.p1 TRINITY_DN609_c0_g1~~TRINITY_DN609_c0_g1_i1.p1  ORF type:complete len:209 (-),score=25.83 TRINITY_DN609_c0_g1_i1:177-803(-)